MPVFTIPNGLGVSTIVGSCACSDSSCTGRTVGPTRVNDYDSVRMEIFIPGHGLSAGDVVMTSGTTWVKASIGDVRSRQKAVVESVSGDKLVIVTQGKVSYLSALEAGKDYYLDNATPGRAVLYEDAGPIHFLVYTAISSSEALIGLGTGVETVRFTDTVGDGVATQFTVTHNLGSENVVVQVRDSDGHIVNLTGVQILGANSIKISFATPPSLDEYTVVISL